MLAWREAERVGSWKGRELEGTFMVGELTGRRAERQGS